MTKVKVLAFKIIPMIGFFKDEEMVSEAELPFKVTYGGDLMNLKEFKQAIEDSYPNEDTTETGSEIKQRLSGHLKDINDLRD